MQASSAFGVGPRTSALSVDSIVALLPHPGATTNGRSPNGSDKASGMDST